MLVNGTIYMHGAGDKFKGIDDEVSWDKKKGALYLRIGEKYVIWMQVWISLLVR